MNNHRTERLRAQLLQLKNAANNPRVTIERARTLVVAEGKAQMMKNLDRRTVLMQYQSYADGRRPSRKGR